METIKQFGLTSTMISNLLPKEVEELVNISNELVGIDNDSRLTTDEKLHRFEELYNRFTRTFHAYAPNVWETISVPGEDAEDSEISNVNVTYLPMTYIRCVYSIFDWMFHKEYQPGNIESYFNYLDSLITFKLS